MKLYVARHGETVSNAEGIIQGHLNSELSARGVEQAHDLAESLKGETIDIIFASDLSRASSTANAVAQALNMMPRLDWRIRERSYGDLEGKHASEMSWEELWPKDGSKPPHNVEPEADFRRRICLFLREFSQEFAEVESALVVAHGGVLNQMRYLEQPDTFEPALYENAQLYEFDYSSVIKNVEKELSE